MIEQPTLEVCGTMIGHYRLLEEIGEGGMGVVYVAEQQEPVHRQVALKIIKPGMDTRQVIARFEAERQTLALLDHPNIAKVLDAGKAESGRSYFVMELVEGASLTDYCDQQQLSTRQRLELFAQVCLAVQHAHQKGIIHRDLKPSNVLVAVYDGVPVPKIIDFGISKAVDRQPGEAALITGVGLMMGTPLYMSPEQAGASGLDVDTRSDIYSLGVMFYELLTGSTPFDAERVRKAAYDEIRRMIREDEPLRPSARISTLGEAAATISMCRQTESAKLSRVIRGELDWIAMKCLEKDRDRRYETANALAADIQRYLANEAVAACPPSAGYRLKKFLQRNKGPVLAATLVLIALVGGTLGTTWGLLREAERADGERQAKQEAIAAAEAEKQAKITAETVIKFVEDKILAAARPKDEDGGLGYDVKLADAVKATLPFVDKSFTAQPLVEARLRMTMGISFLDLGDATTATKQFEAARDLYTRRLGPDDPDSLRSMNNLANSYSAAGRHQDALKLREETLRLTKARLGPDNPNTLGCMHNLANSYAAAGRNQGALKLYEETFRLTQAKLGPNHRDTLGCMDSLASAYRAVGRVQEALKLYEEALRCMKTILGPNDRNTLICMNNLANAFRAVGRVQEALKLHEETLPLRKAKLGPDHHDTLLSMGYLARSYADVGRNEEAIRLREETLRLTKTKLGPNHPDTLANMFYLANAYAEVGRDSEALKLREETLRLVKATLDPDHPSTLVSMNNLANSYADAGRNQEALKLYEETLRLMKAKLGANHPDTLRCMGNLANSYADTGRNEEALKLRQETLKLTKSKLGPDDPLTLRSMGDLARSLLKLDRGREALPIIRATAELWEKLPPTDVQSLYRAACYRALIAAAIREEKPPSADTTRLANEQADRAMTWLKRSIAAGYAGAAHMAKDERLVALRDRADFKKLLAEVTAKEERSEDRGQKSEVGGRR